MKKTVSLLTLLLLTLSLLLPMGVSAETVTQEDYLSFELVDGTYTVTTCVKSISGDLVIPAEYEGKPVTAIRNAAFFECVQLASVTIPDTVTTIGDQAFGSCTHLSKVVIPDSVTSIGFDAFHNTAYYNNVANWAGGWLKDGDKQVWGNALLYIDNCLVASNPALVQAALQEDTRLIAGDAFYGSAIEAVSIPATVTGIGARAFAECKSLTDVYYGGKETAWNELDGADAVGEVTMHYEQLLEQADPEDPAHKVEAPKKTPQTKKTINKTWLWVSVIAGAVALASGGLMVYNAIRAKKAKSAENTESAETIEEEKE